MVELLDEPIPVTKVALAVIYLLLWTVGENYRTLDDGAFRFVASNFIKAAFCLAIWRVWPRLWEDQSFCKSFGDERPLNDDLPPVEEALQTRSNSAIHSRRTLTPPPFGGVAFMLTIVFIAMVYALSAHMDIVVLGSLSDAIAVYLTIPITNLCVLFVHRAFYSHTLPASLWHAPFIQFSGLFILWVFHQQSHAGRIISDGKTLPWPLLLTLAICTATFFALMDVVYRIHHSTSVHLINTLIFAFSCVLGLVYMMFGGFSTDTYASTFTPVYVMPLLLETGRDITAAYTVYHFGSVMQGGLLSLSSAFLTTLSVLRSPSTSSSAILGYFIGVVGSAIYSHGLWQLLNDRREISIRRNRLAVAVVTLSITLACTWVALIRDRDGDLLAPLPLWESNLTTTPPVVGCLRKPLRSHSFPRPHKNYAQFDNVLLIVFFSHARYNANLDYYEEVYGEYFPNILFIGPASREDAGFDHSYDVYVDSYQSDEDLSDPSFYKMAGRMAHHMLYTALQEHDCYDGYLWAPFDTLLNIPRLQQFNQRLFWYHSPWGIPVLNPALGDMGHGLMNKNRHAPPAMVSPDPSLNLTENWRGWGLDWWWGEPHVGVSVCMKAFRKVDAGLRARLAAFTNGQTRLIGGSADTLYIPGRHRQRFMDVLALFLETNCFLEIATPTTVHLVLPPGEPIQFVDHWWIWEPPFNATFVRQKWAEGFEVDTFHTFHWGERGDDGVWRGNHDNVQDVRNLLQESALRQGVSFPASSQAW